MINIFAGGQTWVSDVPNYIWRRNDVIKNYIDECLEENLEEECHMLFLDLASKQFSTQQNTTTTISNEVKTYIADIRRTDLIKELNSQGLNLRNDSLFCQQFIDGKTKAPIQEVVATMKLTNYLFNMGGPRYWSHNHFTLECEMHRKMISGEYTDWYTACEAVKALAEDPPYSYHDDYYDDYY